MKYPSLLAFASIALTSCLMADQPFPKEETQPVPDIMVCRLSPPAPLLKKLTGIEANDACKQSILQNKEAKTTLDRLKASIVLRAREEARKHLTPASLEKLAKAVDFAKQEIVIFVWQGSGQDVLSGKVDPEAATIANFHYQAGRTRDFRTHSVIYAVPKGAKIIVARSPIGRVGRGAIEPQVVSEPDCQLQEAPRG